MIVRYVREIKGLNMIVESRAPLAIVSDKLLKKYVDAIKVDREDIKQRSCHKRFRFGEKVYKSTTEVTLEIVIRACDSD